MHYYDHNAMRKNAWPATGNQMMRYEKGHKDATRQRIVDVAARQFRQDGVAAVGLAGIMTDFESKEDLVKAVLAQALAKREATLRTAAESESGLETSIRDYLSPRHRDNPGGGCPTAALVAEIARGPKATRDAFTGKVSEFIALIATQLRAGSPGERRRNAVAIYGMMVGTLQLARAVNDKRLSDEILASGVSAALALANAER
jgi:TetR/AcrR family transcriptional repressor of nem operon